MSPWDVIKKVFRLSSRWQLYSISLAYTFILMGFLYIEYLPGGITGSWVLDKVLLVADLVLLAFLQWLMIKVCHDVFFYGQAKRLGQFIKENFGQDIPPILLVQGLGLILLSSVALWAKSEDYDLTIVFVWMILLIVIWTYTSFFCVNCILQRSFGYQQWRFLQFISDTVMFCIYYSAVMYALFIPYQVVSSFMKWLQPSAWWGDLLLCFTMAHALLVLTLFLVYIYRRRSLAVKA